MQIFSVQPTWSMFVTGACMPRWIPCMVGCSGNHALWFTQLLKSHLCRANNARSRRLKWCAPVLGPTRFSSDKRVDAAKLPLRKNAAKLWKTALHLLSLSLSCIISFICRIRQTCFTRRRPDRSCKRGVDEPEIPGLTLHCAVEQRHHLRSPRMRHRLPVRLQSPECESWLDHGPFHRRSLRLLLVEPSSFTLIYQVTREQQSEKPGTKQSTPETECKLVPSRAHAEMRSIHGSQASSKGKGEKGQRKI